MKKLTALILALIGFLSAAETAYPADDATGDRLRRGEVVSSGGYLIKHGVWGRMEALVEAPPRVVWKLFLSANDWRHYGLPSLADSRTVTEEISGLTAETQNIHDVYQIIEGRTFDSFANQKPGSKWVNYALQHYDLPWPVKNRWMILKNNNDESRSSEGIYRCDWTKTAGNVQTMVGGLVLEPVQGDPQTTHLSYHVESDPGSSVPRFILKWGVKRSMPAAIHAIRREAARVYGKPAGYLPNTSQLLK